MTNHPLVRTVMGDIVLYEVPSRSSDIPHEVAINLHTGLCDCCCKDFGYNKVPKARKARQPIDIGNIEFHCNHIKRAIADCVSHGDIVFCLPKRQG